MLLYFCNSHMLNNQPISFVFSIKLHDFANLIWHNQSFNLTALQPPFCLCLPCLDLKHFQRCFELLSFVQSNVQLNSILMNAANNVHTNYLSLIQLLTTWWSNLHTPSKLDIYFRNDFCVQIGIQQQMLVIKVAFTISSWLTMINCFWVSNYQQNFSQTWHDGSFQHIWSVFATSKCIDIIILVVSPCLAHKTNHSWLNFNTSWDN